MSTQKPLDTPPSSIRSQSSENASKPPPDARSVAFPSNSNAPSTRAESPSKLPRSVSFSVASRPKNTKQKSFSTAPGPPIPFPSPPVPVHSHVTSPSSSTINAGSGTTTPMSLPEPDDTRPRYHSSVSRNTIPRSQSSSFAGKLQSLRKKIESELSRKRPGSQNAQQVSGGGNKRQSKRALKGTVAGLRPSPALTVPEGMSVADASQLCAAKRADCVLVVDEEEGLSGIFTAKDLAFRVTAEGLDPRITTVSQIMTKNPMVTRDTTSATEALQLMVSRGFRHLPVCNEDGDVVGLLDITKVFHEALAKVERGSTATSQLSAALAGVQTELGPGMQGNPQAAAMLAYVETLRERMALPDLTTVLDLRSSPPVVTPRTSVRDAARLMKERRTTAVCVMEANHGTSAISGVSSGGAPPKIAGIFTSKDVVLRVIAAGLDAQRCSVVRVMTPHPDTAPPTMVVQDALKKMHNGHYLNLPVVESDGRLIGIVDIESMSEDQDNQSGGPMWSKFFEGLPGAGGDDDTASIVSASERPDTPSRSHLGHGRGLSSMTSPISEIMPNDSASAVDDGASDIGGKRGGAASSVAPPLPVDDGTYVFKFKTPSGRTHRFQARYDSFDLLRDIVAGKLVSDPFFAASSAPEGTEVHLPDPNVFTLHYNDDEGDLVTMTADGDVEDAVRIARNQKTDRVVLVVDGGKVWEAAAKDLGGEKAVEALKAAAVEEAPTPVVATPAAAVDPEEAALVAPTANPATEPTYTSEKSAHPVHAPQYQDHGRTIRSSDGQELVAGFLPKDMVLPAAIGFLGVVILGVFIAGKK
ncbi:hypothetical protein L202_02967 [Cryptococcus amylolentus CBS 6039]|uniref:CBS domain-containing protein n=2 Tax=Cryptococcus amylolentus TaxID=104669 RepID=A0A1E3HWY9_9TREE|nr:hypothetical protein L202_02967 [Cryptococcus amylolentus CBS 6039]ODN80817.1 hypothetical protein L202_02967 [Cryptococcus amylolentus CBS 6039]ODO09340.1 hypothetical protein I350_02940 [Cryptococcus amylolentus CBS 6273]